MTRHAADTSPARRVGHTLPPPRNPIDDAPGSPAAAGPEGVTQALDTRPRAAPSQELTAAQ
jgi:hypothetical protein